MTESADEELTPADYEAIGREKAIGAPLSRLNDLSEAQPLSVELYDHKLNAEVQIRMKGGDIMYVRGRLDDRSMFEHAAPGPELPFSTTHKSL